MKKHSFLTVEFQSTVKLSPAEIKKLKHWIQLSSEVLQQLMENKLIPGFKGKSISVSLLICGDSRIRVLNRDHRNKNKVTDVLSFPANESLRSSKMIHDENLFLGDLAISWPRAKKQAAEFGIGVFDEFIHLFFHGVLHLMGFDHELSAKEEKLMEAWEKKALDLFSQKKRAR